MMAEGIELMAVGMGTVFAFLTLLAFAMEFAGRFLSLVLPPDAQVSTSQSIQAAKGGAEAEIALVIAAAHRFREGGGQ